ncbi:copper resistance protein CopC [Nocardioides sp. CFH 31398]|nr:copper resistance protein CopC [Nocardioides sp. CFH 31398]
MIGANPEDGATVQRPPTEVSLEFSEEVSEPAFVSVTTADGIDVTGGSVAVDGARVTRPLAAAAAAGEYTIAYRVVSADGHPIEGETTFTADQPAAAPKASTQPGDDGGATEPTPADEGTAAPSEDPTTADGSDTEPAASQTDESDEGGVSTTVVVVGVVVLVAVVTLLMLARRRGNR